ncbi:hypothetical protein N7493_008579 [Penicillium malachiteum]|uniref:Carbohydrate kinase PfkB domain-containing protein n=1 Tax=Penicillium malachiteum TaxID=1324776 RepID=A0AAD6MTY4_9EURO|nr:hypothetical protein N7493_008579 [Penicillium malachiteum]
MEEQNISFASFGLVVLDEIRFPNQPPMKNILGGSGAYATLGARLFLPPPMSQTLVWPLHIGNDFPDSIKELLQSWNTTLLMKKTPGELSTRGLLEYKDTTFGPKDFKYTTPILNIDENSIAESHILAAKAFHYLATPQDIQTRVSRLLTLRQKAGISSRPLIIWEPAPLSCNPENLQAFLEAARHVDILSPNHLELGRFFSRTGKDTPAKTGIEELASIILDRGVGPDKKGIILIRAGEQGCLIQSWDLPPTWLPPFYDSESSSGQQAVGVVDPTGAGNAFLGGFGVGYIQTKDAVTAACFGTVSASIALEQIGMPTKTRSGDMELWNGTSVEERLQEYMSRDEVELSLRRDEVPQR